MAIPEILQHTSSQLNRDVGLENGETVNLLEQVKRLHQSTDRHSRSIREAIGHLSEASNKGLDKVTARALLAHLEHVHANLQGNRHGRDENDPADHLTDIARKLNTPESVRYLEKILTGSDQESQFSARFNLSYLFDSWPEASRAAARALSNPAVTEAVKDLLHGDLKNWNPEEKQILKAMKKYRKDAKDKRGLRRTAMRGVNTAKMQ